MVEPVSLYSLTALSNVISPAPQFFSYISGKIAKWRLRKRIFSCLITSKGISSLCSKVSNTNTICLDVDFLYQKLSMGSEASEKEDNSPLAQYLIYPLIKDHILRIAQIFKGKIIICSRNLELLRACPVYNENFHCFALSKSGEESAKLLWDSMESHHKNELEKFRVINILGEDKTEYYDSISELEKKFKSYYSILESPI